VTGGSYGSDRDAASDVPRKLFGRFRRSYWLRPAELEADKQGTGHENNSDGPMHRNALSANCDLGHPHSQITSESYCTA
jgi:hypothetical protein